MCLMVMQCNRLRVVASRLVDAMPVCASFTPLFGENFSCLKGEGGTLWAADLKAGRRGGGVFFGRAIRNSQIVLRVLRRTKFGCAACTDSCTTMMMCDHGPAMFIYHLSKYKGGT